MTPLVSVVTVTWNDSPRFQVTCRSLQEQVVDFPIEHIVVDGASDDDTLEWYHAHPAADDHTVVSEKDDGIFDAMNKGIRRARGRYLLFLNAGDLFVAPDSLARATHRLLDSGRVWGYGRAHVVSPSGEHRRPTVGRVPYSRVRHLYGFAAICHQAVLMERELLLELGMFRPERYGAACDYALLLEAARRTPPLASAEVDVRFEAGGISETQIYRQLWRRHRARVDCAAGNPAVALADGAWTVLQSIRVALGKAARRGLTTFGVRRFMGRTFGTS